jgi:hypothetical protein
MKKIMVTLGALLVFGIVNAQDKLKSKNEGQTEVGKWLIEANTAFGTPMGAYTGFGYSDTDGDTEYNVGAEVGYFVIKDLALKVGLGYGGMKNDLIDTNIFSYKMGAKYYIDSQIPVQVDYSGATIKDFDENPSYLGIQAGYAWFLGSNVSVEPGVRYNLTLNDNYTDKNTLQFNIGFVLHF